MIPTPNSDAAISPGSQPRVVDPRPRLKSSGKSKADRKPVYRTAEERPERNKRARLAFRARRSEYFEEKCRSLEDLVAQLKESERAENEALALERAKFIRFELMLRTRTVTLWLHEVPDMFLPASLRPGHPF
jgi:hypothetical protein